MLLAIRSTIYHIFFPLWTAIMTTAFLPFLLFGDRVALWIARTWAWGAVYGLRFICNVSFEFKNIENLPESPCILASKHQSAWDTAIFFLIINKPTFVYKKELSKIPLYGTYLKRLHMIAVDRSGGAKSLKDMLLAVKDRVDNGYSLIIFPEGTRTLPNQRASFKPGVAQMYLDKKINAPIIPVALNSGHHWSKSRLTIPPGKITVEFLPAIKDGMNRKEFTKTIEEAVDTAYQKIIGQRDQTP